MTSIYDVIKKDVKLFFGTSIQQNFDTFHFNKHFD